MLKGRYLVLVPVLACLIGPESARGAVIMAPAITMIYGTPLDRQLFVVPKEISDLHTYAFLSCAAAGPGPVGELGSRPFLKIAHYWDTGVWKRYLDNPALRTELKPETANQHGRLYLPTPTEQAIIVVTDFRIDRPMAIPSSSTEFFKACFLTDEDAQTAHVQEPRAVADTLIDRRVAAAHRGENPYVIARLPSGWAVAGDRQVVHGYCLLLPDPVVPDLNALRGPARSQFLLDMVSLGDALLEVTGAQRINYEILGNLEPALHAHLFPRYDAEPEDLRRRPVWFYDWSQAPIFDPDSYSTFVHTVRSALRRRHV